MHRIILILFSCFLVLFSQAETLKQLKKKQQKAKQNIEMTNRLLRENQRTQKNTVSNLAVLKKQISERQTLIKSLNEEVFLLDRNLNVLNKEKVELETQLSEAKAEYAKLIRHGYYHKTRSSQLMFVFSSESVSQAYRRMRYVQQYSRYRKEQTQKIQELTDALNGKQQALMATKNAKSETLINKQQEHQNLQRSQEKKEQMLSSLTKKESELKVLLEKQQKQAAQLNKKVDDMIAAEIAAGDYVKEAPAYTAPKPKYNDPLRTIANDLREKCEKDGGVTTNKYGEKNGTPTASVWYQKATFTEDKKLDKASYVNIGVDNADGSKTTVKLMNMHGNIVAAVNNGTKGEDGKWNFEDNGFVNSLEDADKLPEAVKGYIVSDVLKLDSEFAKTVAELNAEYANGEKDTEGKPTTAAYYNNLSDTIFIKDAVAGNIEFGRDEKGEITINEVTKGEDGKNVRTAINALDVKSEFQSAVDKVLANEDRTANKDNIERD